MQAKQVRLLAPPSTFQMKSPPNTLQMQKNLRRTCGKSMHFFVHFQWTFCFFYHNLCKNKHLITVLTASLHAERTHELACVRTALRRPLLLYIACTLCGSCSNSGFLLIPFIIMSYTAPCMLLIIVHNQSSFCVSYPNSLAWKHCQKVVLRKIRLSSIMLIILRNIIWSSQL